MAFNDYAPGLGTHRYASISGLSGAVALRNISNGAPVGVTVTVANTGAAAGAIQGHPDYGTPADILFDGYVDLAGKPNPDFRLSGYSFGSSNHMAQDLGIMVEQCWLLFRQSGKSPLT